jgi:arabinose-5-phosphate isomerase
MALGDALAVALMKRRDFREEDFASFHPGGSLGKRLYLKLEKIARREKLPVVDARTPLKEAIVVMSEGKLGNVLVTENGRLKAIMSDGDLRRALMREDFDMERPVLDYATPDPRSLENLSMLASDALARMEEAKIQLMPILDEEKRILGVVHIHDLVSAGIKTGKA